MYLQQLFRRIRRLRLYFILFAGALGMVFAVFGTDILGVFVRHCDAPPSYQADVPPTVRAEIDTLFANDLLFCPEPSNPIEGLNGPIYWGSDGMRSVLFFQADDLTGVGVTEYIYGENFLVLPMGDSPPIGYRLLGSGQPIYRNEAPQQEDGPRPTYFYRRDGAPQAVDLQVAITVRGDRPPREGVVGARDPFEDIERIWDRIRGVQRETTTGGSTSSRVGFPILASDWAPLIRREVTPELATAEGEPSIERLSAAELAEPVVYQRLGGLLGSSLWVAGVVTETNRSPAVVLVGPGDETIEPLKSSVWTSGRAPNTPLALFAFDPLPTDTAFQARYWHTASEAGIGPPDLTWSITFP